MSRIPVLILVAALFAGTAGCGTMANVSGKKLALISLPNQEVPKPFGGLDRDIRWISEGSIFFIMDMPLSLAGDIVTLPFVLWTTNEEHEIRDWQSGRQLLPPEADDPVLPEDLTSPGD